MSHNSCGIYDSEESSNDTGCYKNSDQGNLDIQIKSRRLSENVWMDMNASRDRHLERDRGLRRSLSCDDNLGMESAVPSEYIRECSSDSKLDGREETITTETGELWSQRDSEDTYQSGYDHCDCDGHRVTELQYQSSLRNERRHFMLAEVIMENIELMLSEETYRGLGASSIAESDTKPSVTYCDSGGSSGRMPSSSVWFVSLGSAETVAVAVIEDLASLLSKISAEDGRLRTLPADLQSLLIKRDSQSQLSTSVYLARSNDRLSVAVKERTSLDDSSTFQVGGSPLLGPDLSLPSYIVSRSSETAHKRLVTLASQHNTCPGCRCTFSPDIARRLQFCRYYCLYFCSVCIGHDRSIVPSLVLTRWDFSKRPVSRPAHDLLKRIHSLPLFVTENFSDTLQTSCRVLVSTNRLRRQARLLLHFVENCRRDRCSTMNVLTQLPRHWLSDPPIFSIEDFLAMKAGHMESQLQAAVRSFSVHVSLCDICQARGFLCELCHNRSDVIFPFQIDLVHRCNGCGTCFHWKCYDRLSNPLCPRCDRRRRRLDQQHLTMIDDSTGTSNGS